jgi:hypothetical protein
MVGWKGAAEAVGCWAEKLSVGVALKGLSPNGSSKACIKEMSFYITIVMLHHLNLDTKDYN